MLATGYSECSSPGPELNSDPLMSIIWSLFLLSVLEHHHKKEKEKYVPKMGDPPSFAGGSQVIIHQSSPTSVTFGA